MKRLLRLLTALCMLEASAWAGGLEELRRLAPPSYSYPAAPEQRAGRARPKLSVELSQKLSAGKTEQLQRTFERIEALEFDPARLSTPFKKFYGKEEGALALYLNDRVKFIVDGSESFAHKSIFRPGAVNLGSALWFSALLSGVPRNSVRLNGRPVAVSSTRAGILQLNEEFFAMPLTLQISTLLHEARHSDCSGGFRMTTEDPGAQLCGYRHASGGGTQRDRDRHPWGAYAAEYIFGDALANACTNCSEAERNFGLLIWSDTQSRFSLDALSAPDSDPDMTSSGLLP